MTIAKLTIIALFAVVTCISGCQDSTERREHGSAVEDSVLATVDLPPGLAQMSAPKARAELYLHEHLFTRLDSTARNFVCDEGMPTDVLFAADGRVLQITPSPNEFTAHLELVSAASGEVRWDGCELEKLTVDQHPRIDTVEVTFTRHNQTWDMYYDQVYKASTSTQYVMIGPVYRFGDVDWRAIGARADSIRKALGHPLARRRVVPGGNLVEMARGKLEFPHYVGAGCPAATPAPAVQDFAELSYVDNEAMASASRQAAGDWFAVYTSDSTSGATCIAPVRMVLSNSSGARCDFEGNQKQNQNVFVAEGLDKHPLLLVRNVPGVRTGLSPSRLSVLMLDGWNAGAMVYSDSALVMTILEKGDVRPNRMVYYLTAEWHGQSYPIFGGDAYTGDTWSVYWVGLLNGDDLPDVILRVDEASSKGHASSLQLILSEKRGSAPPSWNPAGRAVVRFC